MPNAEGRSCFALMHLGPLDDLWVLPLGCYALSFVAAQALKAKEEQLEAGRDIRDPKSLRCFDTV